MISTRPFDEDILVRGVHEIFANKPPLLLSKRHPLTFDEYHSSSPYSSNEQSKKTQIKVSILLLNYVYSAKILRKSFELGILG